MSKVSIINVSVLDNPGLFTDPFGLEVIFECLEELPDDIEWKIVYVGSAESPQYDQVLETVYVGPVPEGRHKFTMVAPAPDPSKIPTDDLIGVTVILLMCSYCDQEFLRVGYYVSNRYDDEEMQENPPAEVQFDKLHRIIVDNNPRVTKFKIDWDKNTHMTDASKMEEYNGAIELQRNLDMAPPCPVNALPTEKDPVLDRSPRKNGLPTISALPPPEEDISVDMDI